MLHALEWIPIWRAIYLKVFGVFPLQRHPSPLSGSIWSFHYFFTYIFSLVTVFTSISFLSLFHLYFSYPDPSSVDFFHVSVFSWLFLISLCRSFHIFSSVLFLCYFRILRTGILQGLGLFLRFWVCARTCFLFATLPT